uniref:Uncharacterized protein n=1 Tax=Tremella fuciformis TaxID=64657 RepID=A0A2H4QBH8_9TREE|nr:hypothetical protein [Tremella fuciformis]
MVTFFQSLVDVLHYLSQYLDYGTQLLINTFSENVYLRLGFLWNVKDVSSIKLIFIVFTGFLMSCLINKTSYRCNVTHRSIIRLLISTTIVGLHVRDDMLLDLDDSNTYGMSLPVVVGPEEYDNYIPWDNTQHMRNGIEGLNRMYNSLEPESSLKHFIDSHCSHLLQPLVGNTTIPKNYTDVSVLKQLPGTVKLGNGYNLGDYQSLDTLTGVYVFYTDDEVVQCGSSIHFINRMKSHHLNIENDTFTFSNLPTGSFYWTPVSYHPNYVFMYAMDHPNMSSRDEEILTFFTQQEIRSLEQAYTTFAQPSNYNGHQKVNMWHAKWQVGSDSSFNPTGKRTTWVTSDGESHTRSSIKAAAVELGFGHDRVATVGSVEGATLNTERYGKVTINIEGQPKTDKYPDLRSGTPKNTFVDDSLLTNDVYYLFDRDMNLLPMGPYKTAPRVNEALGFPRNYRGPKHWCNYMHLLKSTLLGISVYVYKVYNLHPKPILVTCLSTGKVTEYPSVKAVVAGLGTTVKTVILRVVEGSTLKTKTGSYTLQCKNRDDIKSFKARYDSFKGGSSKTT